jgi:hypothetical protein
VVSLAAEWVAGLETLSKRFAELRGVPAPSVRVSLANGESFLTKGVTDLPGAGFVSFSVFPEDLEDMLTDPEGNPVTPVSVVVPIPSIVKIELMAAAPEQKRLGFVWRSAEEPPTP